MNREDVIKLAREAGLAYGSDERPLASVTRYDALKEIRDDMRARSKP